MLSCVLRAGAVLAALACFTPVSPASAATVAQIGIADQKADMFADPRLAGLGIRQARLTVAWDALHYRWQRDQLDVWMQGAVRHGIDPLITFGHSRVNSHRLPSPTRLRLEFRAFRARYPWTTTFSTWNEVNHCGEKTCHRERLVADYYRQLRHECPGCTILAAEVLDMPSMERWMRRFRRALGYMPKLWGLHNYVEANRFRTTRLNTMLRLMGRRGRLWLTETGGLVRRRNHSRTDIPEGSHHAARVTRFILDDVVEHHPAIERVYLYHWNAGPPSATWDSALISHHGRERGAFWVLRRVLLGGCCRTGAMR